ncbi:MAG: metallophosphoesterase family protein [Chloroflexota bacterium]
MRYAIFSDIHNHSQALSKALQDAATRQVDRYLCLGDIGVDACISLVRGVSAEAVFGNWEVSGWRHLSLTNQRWVLALPPMRKYDQFWISHAAPTWPASIHSLEQYQKARHRIGATRVFPYYLSASDGLWQAFTELLAGDVPLLFHGHTHRQMVWTFTQENELTQKPKTNFTLAKGETYVVGVGSVGQPKDLPKPGYVIFDSEASSIEFIRFDLT